MPQQHATRLLKLFRRSTVLRTRDLGRYGIPRWALQTLVRSGKAHRVGRGLYVADGAAATEAQSYVEATKVVSHGVITLLSALRMHGMTTQAPFEVWVAIHVKARKPNAEHPPMRFARFSGKALAEGVEVRRISGTNVRVYSPAKTIADCFKFRNKIGIDVAVEALRDGLRQRKATREDIHRMAKLCRVSNVIRSYMQSLAL